MSHTEFSTTGNPDIDGILWGGWRWDSPDNNNTTLTYSFPSSANEYAYAAGVYQFESFNAQQIGAVQHILANISSFANLHFVYDPTPGDIANLRFAEATQIDYTPNDGGAGYHVPGGGNDSAEANPPDPYATHTYNGATSEGDGWFNHTTYNAPVLGSFAYTAGIMHETGHNLGLKHGQTSQNFTSYNGTSFTLPPLPADHDSQEYSVMTYQRFPGDSGGNVDNLDSDYPSTFMIDDIATLQYLYGANFTSNAGNTVYSWSPATGETFINGVSQGATQHAKIFLTIWDGGGNDTYDFSNFTTNETINLNPGAWSTPNHAQLADLGAEHPGTHLARGSVANALLYDGDPRSYIENAIGGHGSDLIVGNVVANVLQGGAGNDVLYGLNGNDVLVGGLGKDVLLGGLDADSFVFTSKSDSSPVARDTISDFTRAQGDHIDLSLIDANSHQHGNQRFQFIGAHAFTHHAGQLRDFHNVVQGDINGDGHADFAITVPGHLIKHDFIL